MAYIPARLSSERWCIRVCILVAIAFVTLGIAEYYYAPFLSLSGRWGRLHNFVLETFGPLGLTAIWVTHALFSLAFARFVWRHSPLKPSDRWYW